MNLNKCRGKKIIAKKVESIRNGIIEFLNPEYIYLTLKSFNNDKYDPLVKVNDNVTIGQPIAVCQENKEINIHSTVSGKVERIEKTLHSTGQSVQTIVVKNDFKNELYHECIPEEEPLNLTKEDIINRIKKWSIIGRGGSGFPTYIKYENANNIDTIILNGVECEPYITSDYLLILENSKEIIKGLEYLMKAAGARKGIIAIKEDKTQLFDQLTKSIHSSNISVKFVKDKYPNGWERYTIKNVLNRTYNRLPSEAGVIVNNVSTAYDVWKAIELNQPISTKLMSITGDGIQNPHICKLIVGTSFEEILNNHINLKSKDVAYVAGGPMTGVYFDNPKFSISRRNNNVLIKKVIPQKTIDKIANECLKCGICSDNCPVGLTPAMINSAFNELNKENMKLYGALQCIECGLCAHICPSNIDLLTNIKKAKLFAKKI